MSGLPNPLALPGYRCLYCDTELIRSWSIYSGVVYVSATQQHYGVLADEVPRRQCPARPIGPGAWAPHEPEGVIRPEVSRPNPGAG